MQQSPVPKVQHTPTTFSIGEVLSAAITTLFSKFLSFVVMGLIIFVPAGILIGIVAALFGGVLAQAEAENSPFVAVLAVLVVLLLAAAWGMLNAAVTFGTFQFVRDGRISIGMCLRRGFSSIFPILGIMICLSLLFGIVALVTALPAALTGSGGMMVIAFAAAFVLLIVIFLRYYVVIPACVIETPGVLGAFARSVTLTGGHRWQILGIVVVSMLLQLAISLVFGLIGGLFQSGAGATASLGALISAILELFLNYVVLLWQAILPAVAYFFLRGAKEGIGIDELVSVFD